MPYIVVDIDTTLADNSHREHFIKGEKTDWDSFHEAAKDDVPFPDVKTLLNLLSTIPVHKLQIIILTARQHKYRVLTQTWLMTHNIPYSMLFTRGVLDKSSESSKDFKLRMLKHFTELFQQRPLFCLEDQQNITEHLRAHGYAVWNVRDSHA